jgi:hypothetical protein
MEVVMKFSPRLIALALPLLLLGGAPTAAHEIEAPQRSQAAQIGTGLICDTQQQVERFISLYEGDAESAVKKVNDAEGNPTACAVATMAYVRGRTLSTAHHHDTAFQIIPILLLGLVTESGVESVTPAPFFSAIEIEQFGI